MMNHETRCCFIGRRNRTISSAIFNLNHTDLNARSRETERSDRARSNRDAINERRFRSIGLIRLNKRTAVVVNLINLHDILNAATDTHNLVPCRQNHI